MPHSKLAVLIPGLGAVATTFIAGTMAVRRGLAKPIGSYSQLGQIGAERVQDMLPFAKLDDLIFGGWDVFGENAYEAALKAGVLDPSLLEKLRNELEAISPMRSVFDPAYVPNLNGKHVKKAANKFDHAMTLRKDISEFMSTNKCSRAVMIWCGSTEVYNPPQDVHDSADAFERGLKTNHPGISPSQIYSYASLMEGIPFANGAPNRCVDLPCFVELAVKNAVPICGSDFKTGQTMLKTVLAPALKKRLLGVSGWFSNNILGNRDGLVLCDPGAFKSKENSKLGVLEDILESASFPELYSDLYHKVRIDYYPPRGDNKESWDAIDLFGWLNYPMQIKVNFLCRDSILAAPLVLDLALFSDVAKRAGMTGMQEWLSFYFKSPLTALGARPIHDLNEQLALLEAAVCSLSTTQFSHDIENTLVGGMNA